MDKEMMKKELLDRIYSELNSNVLDCEDEDTEFSYYSAGRFSAFCNALELLGHEVRWTVYHSDSSPCRHIGCLSVDGEVLIEDTERVFEKN